MKLKVFLFLLLVTLTACHSQKSLAESRENLAVWEIGTKQLSLMNKYQNSDSLTRNKALIDSIYSPNIKLWNGYLGNEKDFINWVNQKAYHQLSHWNQKSKMLNPKYLAEQLRETSIQIQKFTGFSAKGSWYIVYGPAWTDLGGLGEDGMLIDLGNSINDSSEKIVEMYPHELNHQIYGTTVPKTDFIALNRILDEGFATYVSYVYHQRKNTLAKELKYSDEEYNYCTKNDKKLIELLKKYYLSTDDSVSRALTNRAYKIGEGYPGAIGYYLGLRIVEEFVKINGKDSWKRIYTMKPLDVLKECEILQ